MNSQSVHEILEEKWNARSHAIGVFLSLIGSYYLIKTAFSSNLVLAVSVYCLSLVTLFSASTLYHSFYKPNLKKRLRVFDHISIYYLIAGTYTPMCLSILRDSKGVLLLYLVWGIALFGTILKIFFTGKFEIFSLILYAVMGWLVMLDIDYLMDNATSEQLFYLGLGGFFYTIGILFYAIKKIPYNHLIWHFFVLAGAISHFLLVCTLV